MKRVGFRHHLLGEPSRRVAVKETPGVLRRVQAFPQLLFSSIGRQAGFEILALLSLAPGLAGGEDDEEHDRDPELLAPADGRLRDHARSLNRSAEEDATLEGRRSKEPTCGELSCLGQKRHRVERGRRKMDLLVVRRRLEGICLSSVHPGVSYSPTRTQKFRLQAGREPVGMAVPVAPSGGTEPVIAAQ